MTKKIEATLLTCLATLFLSADTANAGPTPEGYALMDRYVVSSTEYMKRTLSTMPEHVTTYALCQEARDFFNLMVLSGQAESFDMGCDTEWSKRASRRFEYWIQLNYWDYEPIVEEFYFEFP